MEALLETKLLDLNETKTVFMILGSKKYKEETRKKLEETPLVLNNKPMKEVEKYSYLGEVLSSGGLSACNSETISKRIGIAHKTIYEIKSIIEDPRNMKPGGVHTAIQIWEMSVMPALLFSSECWFNLEKKELN